MKPKLFTIFTAVTFVCAAAALALICLEMNEDNLFEALKTRFF